MAASFPRPACARIECDVCGERVRADDTQGLLLFARGDRVRDQQPPLCARCAHAIGMAALVRVIAEEEEG